MAHVHRPGRVGRDIFDVDPPPGARPSSGRKRRRRRGWREARPARSTGSSRMLMKPGPGDLGAHRPRPAPRASARSARPARADWCRRSWRAPSPRWWRGRHATDRAAARPPPPCARARAAARPRLRARRGWRRDARRSGRRGSRRLRICEEGARLRRCPRRFEGGAPQPHGEPSRDRRDVADSSVDR